MSISSSSSENRSCCYFYYYCYYFFSYSGTNGSLFTIHCSRFTDLPFPGLLILPKLIRAKEEACRLQ